MTKIKAKLRRIGNSYGVILPKDVITLFTPGEEIELCVITLEEKAEEVITKQPENVITTPQEEDKVITKKRLVFNEKKGIYEPA